MTGPAQNIAIRGNKMSGRNQILDMPRVSVSRSTTQTIPLNTATFISFDTSLYDVEGIWGSTGAPTLFTIRTAGIYLLTCRAIWQLDASSFRKMTINKNGVAIVLDQQSAGGDGDVTSRISEPASLSAGDVLAVFVQHNIASAGTLTISSAAFTATLLSTTT